MSLEAMSSEQFMNFVRFAREETQAGRATSVARLGEKGALGAHVISVGNDDRVGAWRRSDMSMRYNDDIRAEFKACVVDMFGGAANVPKDVEESLRLKDYGEGKPLTARRIMKVAEKVAPLAERLAAAKAKALAGLGMRANNPEVARLVDVALKRCIGDADAMDLVADSIAGIVMRDKDPRHDDEVISRVDGFAASAKDIRKAAKGNATIADICKRFFKEYGKPLEPGKVAEIVRTVHAMSFGPLKRLSANSPVTDLYKAVAAMMLKVDAAVRKTAMTTLMKGVEETSAIQLLMSELAIEHCGMRAVPGIADSLHGDAATELYTFLDDVVELRLVAQGAGDSLKHCVSDVADSEKSMIGTMFRASANLLGRNDDFAIGYDADISAGLAEKDTTSEMLTDIYADGATIGEGEHAKFIKKFIHGKGEGAKLLNEVYTNTIGEYPMGAITSYRTKATNTAEALLKWTIASECRLMAQGRMAETKFALSLASRLAVGLPDGTVLSKNLDEACDQIASFVTSGLVKRYADLQGERRNKAHIVMSMLSMETARIAYDGHYLASADNTFVMPVTEHSDEAKDVHRLTLGVDKKGTLVFTYSGTKSLTSIEARVPNENGELETKSVNVARGSKSEAKLTFKIDKDEMDRLAKADFADFDDTAAIALRDEGQSDPERAVRRLNRDFMVDGDCVLENVATFA